MGTAYSAMRAKSGRTWNIYDLAMNLQTLTVKQQVFREVIG